jgi:AbrB family looped-hinge helix DNA binding protein
MSLVKVKRFAQVTLPADIRRRVGIEQGDYVEVSCDDKRIILTPKRVSDKKVDWPLKFDEVLGSVRKAAKAANINEKVVDQAVKSVRQRRGR